MHTSQGRAAVRDGYLHLGRWVHLLRLRTAPRARPAAGMQRLREEAGTHSGPPDSPIFVLGSGWRCGSTWLQRMINATPGVLMWGEPFGEGALVQRLAESLAFLDPDRGRFHGRVVDGDALPGPTEWTANLTPPLPDLLAAQRCMLDRLLGAPALDLGFPRWGVKEVVWGRAEIDLLTTLYPECRIVALVRDPLDQWRSYRPLTRQPWFQRWPERPIGTPTGFGRMWNGLVTGFHAAAAELPQVILLRYEDLPEATEVARVSTFLGLDQPMTALPARVGSSRALPGYRPSVPPWERAVLGRRTSPGAALMGYA